MTATARRARLAAARAGRLGPWVIVAQGAAALAVSMGIGRFVYTPILPLMGREAGLSKSFGATLATANYAGYLLGALAGIVAPALVRSTWVMRLALSASVATLALMPASHDHAAWFVLRFVGGGASALVFVFAVSTMLSHLRHADHLVGWGFGGVGAGIALSGVLVLITGSIWSWSAAWWSSALAALLLSGLAWGLPSPEPERQATASPNADRVPPVPLVHGAVCLLLTGGHRLHHRRHVPGGGHRSEVSRMGRRRCVDSGRHLRGAGVGSLGGTGPPLDPSVAAASSADSPSDRHRPARRGRRHRAGPGRGRTIRVDVPRHRVAGDGAGRPPTVPSCHRASDHWLQRRPDPRPANRQATAPQRVLRCVARRRCDSARRRGSRRSAASGIPTPRRRDGRAISPRETGIPVSDGVRMGRACYSLCPGRRGPCRCQHQLHAGVLRFAGHRVAAARQDSQERGCWTAPTRGRRCRVDCRHGRRGRGVRRPAGRVR